MRLPPASWSSWAVGASSWTWCVPNRKLRPCYALSSCPLRCIRRYNLLLNQVDIACHSWLMHMFSLPSWFSWRYAAGSRWALSPSGFIPRLRLVTIGSAGCSALGSPHACRTGPDRSLIASSTRAAVRLVDAEPMNRACAALSPQGRKVVEVKLLPVWAELGELRDSGAGCISNLLAGQ
jgi:hypothetical protein